MPRPKVTRNRGVHVANGPGSKFTPGLAWWRHSGGRAPRARRPGRRAPAGPSRWIRPEGKEVARRMPSPNPAGDGLSVVRWA